ncbi:flagellar basal body-associated protein FliL [Bacillus spongiae]|uniref:Flagellar protein FliL n=1 Tax=Bacillus spongiae TaxID=2683610 RepID=A0ABU8HAE0_9BACI
MKPNNKLLSTMFLILVTITLVGVTVLILLLNSKGEAEEINPTIDEIRDSSVDISEITTNLYSDDFIRISFKIQTDSKKAKSEVEKRDFQIRNIIIEELSEVKAQNLRGKAGKQQFESLLTLKFNELIQEGKVEKVYITSSVIQ